MPTQASAWVEIVHECILIWIKLELKRQPKGVYKHVAFGMTTAARLVLIIVIK